MQQAPTLQSLREAYPAKFTSLDLAFERLHPGARIFVHTGCAEPQHLMAAFTAYLESHPKSVLDAEIHQVWSLGVAPYTNARFKRNFRLNSFFIGTPMRTAINAGLADYTPVFLSRVPHLLQQRHAAFDVALIQTSLPDSHGYLNLGISVDIVRAALEHSELVIAQVNAAMPRVSGDGFIHVDEVDLLVPHDEPLLNYCTRAEPEVANRIGRHVARIVQDGDTIQVGYGSIPNAILGHLKDKKHLGVHTELLADGLVDLMRLGVVDNSRKSLDRGKSVASFSMGNADTYAFLHDNPAVQFRTIDYTNDPLTIARQANMVAINSCLQIDLTGQATSESIDQSFYSSIGGMTDFMRGALLAPNGRTVLTIQSTAKNDTVSRIVPELPAGSGVTLNRGDVHYVVTEFGIAYLHGKNIRERAMELIAIAHPKFRPELIEAAKRLNLIFRDQAFIPGKRGEYPEHLETRRTTKKGLHLLLRPVRLRDEPLLKEFFYSLSDRSLYRRFISSRVDMPHERLQDFVIIDYSKETIILACVEEEDGREQVVGVGQYGILAGTHTAEVAFVVSDNFQNRGIGTELLVYLEQLARRQGLLGFVAEVLVENLPMLHLFESLGYDLEKRHVEGVYELRMAFHD